MLCLKTIRSVIPNLFIRYFCRCLILAVVLMTAGFQISCPPPETLENIDTGFDPAFHDGIDNNIGYAPSKVNAVAIDQRTGSFFVGGSFTSIDNVMAYNIAFYDRTHDRFYRLFGKGLKQSSDFTDSYVNALAIAGEYLYVGGSFSQTANATPITGLNNIARYYIGSGSLEDVQAGFFSPLTNDGLNGNVNALEVFNNDLYVGGSFSNTFSGSVSGLNNIARYGINCASNCWSNVHNGFNNTVFALEKGIIGNHAGNVLYIGGDFTALVGSPTFTASRFTAYEPDNGPNGAMVQFPGLNGTVKALAYDERRLRIYAGGSFTADNLNTVTLNRVAYFNGGSGFLPMPQNGLNGDVNALAVYEYLVFAGGDFTQATDGVPSSLNRIAYFDSYPGNETWAAFGSGLNASVLALATFDPGGQTQKHLIVGGSFTRDNSSGPYLKKVVRLEFFAGNLLHSPDEPAISDSATVLGYGSRPALDNVVNATAVDSNGYIYAGGVFTQTVDGGTVLNRIARYDPVTKTWSPLANNGLNNNVEAMIVVGNQLYVGGYFTATADGSVTNLRRIARYDLTTNTWSPVAGNGLAPTVGIAYVSGFAVKGNTLYVGGNFARTFDNSVTNLNNLARYNLTANTWSPFANNGMNGTVNSLAIVGDELYMCGGFTRTFDNSYDRFAITRFNLTDETWYEFANSGLNAEARRLFVYGGFVYVNGSFSRTKDNTIVLNSLGRYDIANDSWAMVTGSSDSRNAVIQTYSATQVGNDVYAGGNFRNTENGVAHFFTRFYLEQWKSTAPTTDWFDGVNWTTGAPPPTNTNAVIPSGSGDIIINSGDVTLNSLNVNGGVLTVGAGRTLTINGTLSLNGGMIVGEGSVVIAGCDPSAVSGGGPASYVQSTLVRCVSGDGAFNFETGTASGYSPVTLKNSTGTGMVSVRAREGAYSGAATGLPASRILRWWTIENPGGGLIGASVFLNYRQADSVGNESAFRAFRISGGVANAVSGTANSFSNVVEASNVTGFSDWTVAELAPSAASVVIGGRIVDQRGRGLNNVSVNLTGSGGVTRSVRSNPFGFYSFDSVEVGSAYILSAESKRYAFQQNQRLVYPKEDMTDLDFIVVADLANRIR